MFQTGSGDHQVDREACFLVGQRKYSRSLGELCEVWGLG